MDTLTFSLVIPLFNEEKNVPRLVDMLNASGLPTQGMKEVLLVNNGSKDLTGKIIDELFLKHSWIRPLHLPENLNYGGGVYSGFLRCRTDIVAYIPGDLQVSAQDLKKIWDHYQEKFARARNPKILVKGRRTVRKDGFTTQLVSRVYTLLANLFLNVCIKDVNGLPKMFHKDLLKYLPDEKMQTFVFDAQLIFTARKAGWEIIEVPVTFHARREGVSSWSRKRLGTYWETFRQILKLRKLRHVQIF